MKNLLKAWRGEHTLGEVQHTDPYFEESWNRAQDHKAKLAAWRDIANIKRQAAERVKARLRGETPKAWDLTITKRIGRIRNENKTKRVTIRKEVA